MMSQASRNLHKTSLWAIMTTLLLVSLSALWSPTAAADTPAREALADRSGKPEEIPLIQNRFFLKANRFEFGPSVGYVPNNAFVVNPTINLNLAYHFSETFAAEGLILYGLGGGYKNLTVRLVQIADESGSTNFQQPADTTQLGALFAARWAPVYGKINLIGEGVLNFDLYGTLGAGLLVVKTQYYVASDDETLPVQTSDKLESNAHPAINLGLGMNFFLNQSLALKLDARSSLYFAPEPDYGTEEARDSRLYAPFVASAGISIFVPKMKPRIFNF